jgi:hypothetical protein
MNRDEGEMSDLPDYFRYWAKLIPTIGKPKWHPLA